MFSIIQTRPDLPFAAFQFVKTPTQLGRFALDSREEGVQVSQRRNALVSGTRSCPRRNHTSHRIGSQSLHKLEKMIQKADGRWRDANKFLEGFHLNAVSTLNSFELCAWGLRSHLELRIITARYKCLCQYWSSYRAR